MVTQQVQNKDEFFNLTIEEIRMILKYRTLPPHQQKGVMQAMDKIRPARAARRFSRP